MYQYIKHRNALDKHLVEREDTHLVEKDNLIKSCYIQGDSKRLLKVHELVTSIFYEVGDLKFNTEPGLKTNNVSNQ